MTLRQAKRIFKIEIIPYLEHTDKVAIRTAFNDWTDYLCKNGDITTKQYNNWIY